MNNNPPAPIFDRGSGILLHLTSLPGNGKIGNLGSSAYRFIDYLAEGGQKYWQILPLGPVSAGYSYSPYSSHSSFAGNPLIIDPESLQAESWVREDILQLTDSNSEWEYINYEAAEAEQKAVLEAAFRNFKNNAQADDKVRFRHYCETNRYWLNDYALFEALSARFNTLNWRSWEKGIRSRDVESVKKYENQLEEKITFTKFVQFIFDSQWQKLKNHSSARGVKIIGDIPIYVSMDSADTWANNDIFQFNEDMTPQGVSGVPPDYFSEKGQKWGNPLYRWNQGDSPENKTFLWWHDRIARLKTMVDIIRIDHFRGFESYWKIPPESEDGILGKWEQGPGIDLFHFLKKEIPGLKVIAEDLGIITEAVNKLRRKTGFPGMKILQFAFDLSPDNPYLPSNIKNPNCVIYTGTHDNNTSAGWFMEEINNPEQKETIRTCLGFERDEDFLWKFIEASLSSIAVISIIPLQDLLGLKSEARLNTPGSMKHSNWRWKATRLSFPAENMKIFSELCKKNGR